LPGAEKPGLQLDNFGVRKRDSNACCRRFVACEHRLLDSSITFGRNEMRRGCLYGNLSAEASETSEAIRFRVASVFAENQASVAYCLQAAVDAGELAYDADVAAWP